MARLTPEQRRFLNLFDRSAAMRLIDRDKMLTLLYALRRKHLHIPEESMACLYLEVAENVRDALQESAGEEHSKQDLVNSINAVVVELSALASALTWRQRGTKDPWGD